MKKENAIVMMIAVLAVFLAVGIYFLRSNTPVLITLLKEKVFGSALIDMKLQGRSPYMMWFINSFPDGLWTFAFTLTLLLIWQPLRLTKINFWIPMSLGIGIGSEILQNFQIIPGTFDLMDILISVIFFLIAVIVFSFIKKQTLKFFKPSISPQ